MGSWGVALFSDDLAADVRNRFRELIGDGLSAANATRRLVEEYRDSLRDPEERPVFWLALAATQWNTGHLEQQVLDTALDCIERGTDLERWAEDPDLREKRRVVLEKLRLQLTSKHPSPKKLPKIHKAATNWNVGDLASYRLLSGRPAVFRVIGHHEDNGGRFAVCEILDWTGTGIPTRDEAAGLSVLLGESGARSQFLLGPPTPGQRGKDRLVHLGLRTKPLQRPEEYLVFPWKYLDRQLAEVFGLK